MSEKTAPMDVPACGLEGCEMVNSGFVKCPGGACVKAYDGKGHTWPGKAAEQYVPAFAAAARNWQSVRYQVDAERVPDTCNLVYDSELPPPQDCAPPQPGAAYAHCRSCGQGYLFPLSPTSSVISTPLCACGTPMEVALDPAPQHNHYASAGQSVITPFAEHPAPGQKHNLMHTQEP